MATLTHTSEVLEEVWKPVEGFPNYEVSSEGRVRSLRRWKVTKAGWKTRRGGMVLKQVSIGAGYRGVALYNENSEKIPHYVHRLVAKAFLPNPNGCAEVNHKNFDKADNRLENLEWCTRKENANHRDQAGKNHARTNPKRRLKLTEESVDEIKRLLDAGEMQQKDIASMFSISKSMVSLLSLGRTWNAPNSQHTNRQLG